MICARCGAENSETAQFCKSCGRQLGQTGEQPSSWGAEAPSPAPAPALVPINGLAIASLILGVAGIPLLGVPAVAGLALGVIGLTQINRSGGRMKGTGVAVAGLCVCVLAIALAPTVTWPRLWHRQETATREGQPGTSADESSLGVLGRSREEARKVQCLSNVKNIALAVQMYAAEWDAFPEDDQWCWTLDEYIGNRDIYRCPSAPDLTCGYAYNSYLSRISLAALDNPAYNPVAFESDLGWNGSGGREALVPEPRHLEGDNWGYADGHAKWIAREEADRQIRWGP